jgi:GNAT superfamily N-acetyltransferase
MSTVEIVQLDESNLDRVPMLCGHSPTYRGGYKAKQAWLQERLGDGMRYRLLQVNGYNAGMVEFIPGEHAWRGVEAPGYLFIHCFWVVGRNRGHGYGRLLLQGCIEEARGTNGLVVMVSKAHWLPTPRLFIKNGFELADQADPSFDLLVMRNSPTLPLPSFTRVMPTVQRGLTVYHSDQCPYTQNVPAIAVQVGSQLGIQVNIIRVQDSTAAREMPCPYGTLAYFFNGKLLTYHPAGSKKLNELLSPELS